MTDDSTQSDDETDIRLELTRKLRNFLAEGLARLEKAQGWREQFSIWQRFYYAFVEIVDRHGPALRVIQALFLRSRPEREEEADSAIDGPLARVELLITGHPQPDRSRFEGSVPFSLVEDLVEAIALMDEVIEWLRCDAPRLRLSDEGSAIVIEDSLLVRGDGRPRETARKILLALPQSKHDNTARAAGLASGTVRDLVGALKREGLIRQNGERTWIRTDKADQWLAESSQ